MALRTLYQTLLDSDFARLRVIAHQWHIALVAERRSDAAAELADALARAESVERALADLSEDALAALHALLRHAGALPWSIFIRDWGVVRSVGPGRLEREELWRTPVSPAEDLWYRGWVQRAFAERETGSVAMAFVPDELRLYLPEPPAIILPPLVTIAPPVHCELGDDALAEALVSFWIAVQHAGGHGPAMSPPMLDKVQRDFLETLALEQGWVRQHADGSLHLVPEPVLAWLHASVEEQWSALAQAWIDSTRWDDLAHVPTLRPDPVKGWPTAVVAARQRVLDMVRRCEPEQWYAVADFVAYMHAHATDFLRPDGDYDAWALRSAESDIPLRGFSAWESIEGALITFLLTGPCAWLGLVDVGGASPLQPTTAFRLTAMGASVLGLREAPSLAEPPRMRWLPDGLLVISARRRYERFQLSRVAQALSPSAAGLWHYRFTPASLARAQRQHITLPRIFDFLQQATGQAIPTLMRGGLEAAYTGKVIARLERVCLLRVMDDTVLTLPTIQPLIQDSLAPGVALIRAADYERVLGMLTRQGVLADFADENFNISVPSRQKLVTCNL